MNKHTLPLLLVVAVVAMSGIATIFIIKEVKLIKQPSVHSQNNAPRVQSNTLPDPVVEKYNSLLNTFGQSEYGGASIFYCKKNGESIYQVKGGGGFSVNQCFYDETGKEIGCSSYSDMPGQGEVSGERVQIFTYNCQLIRDSGEESQS